MNLIRNERGGAGLLYVVMISMILMIVTPAILFMTSNDAARNKSDNHTRTANNLAVSSIESFVAYLSAYTTGDRLDYLNNYPGFMTKAYSTPEGTNVLYSLIKSGPTDNKYTITMTASVGADNVIRTKKIVYTINSNFAPAVTMVSTGPDAERTEVNIGEGFYVQGETSNGVTGAVEKEGLQDAIGAAITYYQDSVTTEVANNQDDANICNCTTQNDITNAINNSTDNPVIIEMSQDISFNGNLNLSWGTDLKPVILIFNSVTFNNKVTLDITGDVIFKNDFTLHGDADITINKVEDSYGNLYVMDHLTGNNKLNITVEEMLYTGNIILNNNSPITAGKMVVENTFLVNNNAALNIGTDLLAGSITVHNNSTISATAGDILVENNFLSNNNIDLTTGGVIAAGGNFTVYGNNSEISTGGETSSLIIPTAGTGGSSGGTGGTSTGWGPVRQ